jgi:hypothetical protein
MLHNESILVLGAGELGMAMLRSLVRRAAGVSGPSIAVLLRPSTIDSEDPRKQKDIGELRALGVELIPGDLSAQSVTDLAAQARTRCIRRQRQAVFSVAIRRRL